jgi:hypothetical protein
MSFMPPVSFTVSAHHEIRDQRHSIMFFQREFCRPTYGPRLQISGPLPRTGPPAQTLGASTRPQPVSRSRPLLSARTQVLALYSASVGDSSRPHIILAEQAPVCKTSRGEAGMWTRVWLQGHTFRKRLHQIVGQWPFNFHPVTLIEFDSNLGHPGEGHRSKSKDSELWTANITSLSSFQKTFEAGLFSQAGVVAVQEDRKGQEGFEYGRKSVSRHRENLIANPARYSQNQQVLGRCWVFHSQGPKGQKGRSGANLHFKRDHDRGRAATSRLDWTRFGSENRGALMPNYLACGRWPRVCRSPS